MWYRWCPPATSVPWGRSDPRRSGAS
jgi:hypothetical protein